jgi:hypothetical protein
MNATSEWLGIAAASKVLRRSPSVLYRLGLEGAVRVRRSTTGSMEWNTADLEALKRQPAIVTELATYGPRGFGPGTYGVKNYGR